MLRVRLAKDASGFSLPHGARWVYLGKDARLRAECEGALGASSLLDVTDLFHRTCEELRRPFLEFVAKVGARQQDRLGWASSRFAWKDPDASDLFLLAVYLRLIESIEGDVVIVLEDPWLFEQCRRNARDRAIEFGRRPSLIRIRAQSLLRAIAARAVWLSSIVREYLGHVRHARRYRSASRKDVWLYSLPHPRCFTVADGWRDPFFGELPAMLEKRGLTVGRLIPPDPLGFASELARRVAFVCPVIINLSLSRLLRSAIAIWNVGLDELPLLDGMDVALLAQREWWSDFQHASWCQHRLFYECARVSLARNRPNALIFPYENQPWERVLVMAARDAGVRTVGHQHSTVPRFLLSYFFGSGEAERSPVPDAILTAGRQQAELIVRDGTPASKVRVAGSLRYSRASREGASRSAETKRVIVIATHDLALTRDLLSGIEAAFPDRGVGAGVSFHYRPHPTLAAAVHPASDWMTLVEGDLGPQLSGFDAVVTTGSTVGLEAVMLGLPVVKYRADVLIDLDPLDAIPESEYLTAGRSSLREVICAAVARGRREPSDVTELEEAVFGRVSEDVWIEALKA